MLFKAKHNLQTTPLIFIDEKKIGGYSDLVEFFKNSELQVKMAVKKD